MAVCGFDLGTQNLLVAVAQKRGIDVLANEASNRQTPAVVSFGEGERCIGESGAVKKMRNLRNSLWNIKRLLGKSWSDADGQVERKKLQCRFVENATATGSDLAIQVEQGGERQIFSPTQLAAMLLGKMADVVELETKTRPGFSVVAVPGFFTERERQEALNAAEIANIRPIGLITETAAIALGYGIYKEWPKAESDATLVAFVDFGASSFSVSIVSFCQEGLRVLASAYDRQLGGRDFDLALYEYVRNKIQQKHRIDVSEQQRTAARLLQACESVKKTLSTCPDATIFLENLDDDLDFSLAITRAEFEEICEPLFSRIEAPIKAVLAGATQRKQHLFKDSSPIQLSDITAVEVTGGSWRIPKVTRVISDCFGRDVSKTLNSEEAVVRGAALRCAQLCPVFRTKDFKVRDASPYSIEFSLLEDTEAGYRTIFPRNQSIPCTMQLSYPRADPFSLSFRYTADSGTPEGSPTALYTFSIPSVPASEIPDQVPKVFVKTGLDRSGFIVCNAYADVPVVNSAPATPAASTVSDDKPAEEKAAEDKPAAEQPLADDPAPPAAETSAPVSNEPKFKLKRVTLDCHVEPLGTPKNQLDAWIALEQKLRAADRLFLETAEARNNLESYILALRSKLSSTYEPFSTEDEKNFLRPLLDQTEDWLYDDGADATKQTYEQKIAALKAKGEPIAKRAFEHEERPVAVSDLRTAINHWRTQLRTTDPNFAHIEKEDRDRVEENCTSAENWINEQLAAQEQRLRTEDPTLLAVDIRQRITNLGSSCSAIMNKPKPPPPKVETPPPAASPAPEANNAAPNATSDDAPTPTSDDASPTPTETPAPLVDDVMD